MLFSNLEYWWDIYAPFQSVTRNIHGQEHVYPHAGQILHYRRKMRGMTKSHVAKTLGWSQKYLSRVEADPFVIEDAERLTALINLLQIPVELMGGENEDPGAVSGSSTTSHIQQLLQKESGIAVQDSKSADRLSQGVLKSKALSTQEQESYEHALGECQMVLLDFEPPFNFTAIDTRQKDYIELLREVVNGDAQDNPEKHAFCVKNGLRKVGVWLQKIDGELEQAAGLRRDQLLYVQYHFYLLLSFAVCLDDTMSDIFTKEKRLACQTKLVYCARRLGNAWLASEALIARYKWYLQQQQEKQALRDLKETIFYIGLLTSIPGCLGEARDFLDDLSEYTSYAQEQTRARMDLLLQKAYRMLQPQRCVTGTPHLSAQTEESNQDDERWEI